MDTGVTGTTPSRRGRRKPADTKARIVTLTRNLIAHRGLASIKARTVAREADVSVGTIYNLFGHLDDLLRLANAQTYESLHAHQTEALARAREAGASPDDQLRALATAYLDWVGTHHALWSATLAFNRERIGEAPDWYRAKEMALLSIIEDALGGFAAAPTDAERAVAARALWASIHGVVSISMGAREMLLPREDIEAQMEWIVGPVADRLSRGPLA